MGSGKEPAINAYMNISVRVLSANAQAQIKALQAQVRALEGQLATANATASAPNAIGNSRSRKTLGAWGNQIQWTGRQLQYNWTLPLLLAGGAAAKFSLDNEKAFTRVQKVYGDAAAAADWYRKHQAQIPAGMSAAEAAAASFENELDALSEAFEALSSRYGIQQKEVLETAGAWAAAGASGRALAESTELSIKAAILGDMELAKATEALIAIQSQYSLSTAELNLTLAELNAIENQTGISMQGLIDGFARSAGVAREAGVDVRHLGAMLAALVPATGSAATAGNALKTIISRLMSPTGDAADVMREFGVNTADAAWQSSTAMERLLILADHMGDTLKKTGQSTKDTADDMYELSDSQKQVVASVLGSRYQMNRFLVLMRELGPANSYYEKALDATANRSKVFAQMTKELNAVLDSNPKKLEIIWYTLQNGMADAIQPMIPYILYLTSAIANLVLGFSNLDPATQKFFLFFGLGLALVGPFIKYMGSFLTLMYALGAPFRVAIAAYAALTTKTVVLNGVTTVVNRSFLAWFGTLVKAPFRAVAAAFGFMVAVFSGGIAAILARFGKFLSIRAALAAVWGALVAFGARLLPILLGPWGIAIAAVLLLIVTFRDQLGKIWNNVVEYFSDSNNAVVQGIINAWNMLPQGVANALTAVAKVVQAAAMQIYEWFSYINPFARHSPSLVDNVVAGMAKVKGEFAGLSVIGRHLKGAYSDIKKFGAAVANLTGGAASFEQAQNRAKIKKFAPGALEEFDALARRLKILQGDLARVEARMDRQQAVVDRWTDAVDRANAALDKQQDKLDKLTAIQSKWQDKLDEAQQRLSDYANAPIEGMGEMQDKIFANEMAQKALRLEMLKMEEVTGSLDDIKSKIDAITGAQELLRGEQADLRAGGAGSEILKHYDDQIAALEQQKDAQEDASEALQNMSNQLEELQKQAEILDLENSLAFDPLTYAIEKAANAMKELPFDEIMEGVQQAQKDIKKYQNNLDAATQAVDKQQAVVDRLTAARDRLQNRLDNEQAKLDRIKDTYDDVSEAISEVESVMNDALSAADTMAEKMDKAAQAGKNMADAVSPAVQNFRDAAGGNFANVGGDGIPIRMNWADQTADIKDFTKDLSQSTADIFAELNPFEPIKRKWGEFKGWMKNAWNEIGNVASDFLSHAFDGVSFGGAGATEWMDRIRKAWAATYDFIQNNVIKPIMAIWRLFWPNIKGIAQKGWEGLKAIWDKIGPEIKAIAGEMKPLWEAIKNVWAIAKPILGFIIGRFLFFGKIVFSVVEHTIKPILETIGGVFGNLLQIVRGVIQVIVGILTLDFGKALAGIGNIISGVFGGIGQIIWGALKTIVGAVWGIVKGIWDFFVWLYDELVGHSIIPDLIDGIIAAFKVLVKIVKWLWTTIIMPIVNLFKKLWSLVQPLLKAWWEGVKLAWAILKTVATWLWDNVLKPIFNKVKELWDNFVWPALKAWWEGIKLAWNVLIGVATWLWNNVLKPIWNVVKELWTDYVRPGLRAWWEGIKTAWNALKKAGEWIWNHVLQPVWNQIVKLWNKIGPELKKWWDRLKNAWNNLKQGAVWLWTNVLQPVWNRVSDLWSEKVGPELRKWWERIKGAWDKIKGASQWIKEHVMDPVFNAFKNGWERVRGWFSDKFDWIVGPMKTIVKGIVEAINWIIKGLNKLDDLPGISISISEINLPENWAIGTAAITPHARRVGGGFKTNGPRAIVGEGKANYPEFVIPTDPTHRRRATTLLGMAAKRLGHNFAGARGDSPSDMAKVLAANPQGLVPKFDIGGLIGTIGDIGKGTVNLLSGGHADDILGGGRRLIALTMKPFFELARDAARSITNGWPEDIAVGAINLTQKWVDGVNESYQDQYNALEEKVGTKGVRGAQKWARSQVGKPYKWGGVGPDGYDCSGFMSAITNVIRGNNPYSRVGTTAGFPWAGFTTMGPYNRGAFIIGSSPNYSGGVGHMAGTLGGLNVESAGGVGVRVGSSARGYMDSGFTTRAQLTGAKYGAIIKRRMGGTAVRVGEGSNDEAIMPLPRDWDSRRGGPGGETTNNFYGDLVFPNITDPADAKTFIDNLENLAKD